MLPSAMLWHTRSATPMATAISEGSRTTEGSTRGQEGRSTPLRRHALITFVHPSSQNSQPIAAQAPLLHSAGTSSTSTVRPPLEQLPPLFKPVWSLHYRRAASATSIRVAALDALVSSVLDSKPVQLGAHRRLYDEFFRGDCKGCSECGFKRPFSTPASALPMFSVPSRPRFLPDLYTTSSMGSRTTADGRPYPSSESTRLLARFELADARNLLVRRRIAQASHEARHLSQRSPAHRPCS